MNAFLDRIDALPNEVIVSWCIAVLFLCKVIYEAMKLRWRE